MRVVLDTNVLVRANPKASGVARALLREFTTSPRHILVTSPFILTEVSRVLAYPRLQVIWPLAQQEIAEYVEALGDLAEVVYATPRAKIVRADPDDDPVIETALLGRADYLCTLDRHFYSPDVQKFLRERAVKTLSDIEMLDLLRRDE